MNRRELKIWMVEHGCPYNHQVIGDLMDQLTQQTTGGRITRWVIVNTETFDEDGGRIYLIRLKGTQEYRNQNLEPYVNLQGNIYKKKSELDAEGIEVVAGEYFTAEEIRRIELAKTKWNFGRVMNYHEATSRRGYGNTTMYECIGILKYGENDNSITFGFELETAKTSGLAFNSRDARVNYIDARLGHAERDGSISGLEFISHVFTWKKLKAVRPLIEDQLNNLVKAGLTTDRNTGLHIHIGRQSFKSKEALQKFYFLVNCEGMKEKWEWFARREENNYCSYSSIEQGNIMHLRRSMNAHVEDHGRAVNQQHDGTIELRICNATLSSDVLYGTLEAVANLVEFCNSGENNFCYSMLFHTPRARVLSRMLGGVEEHNVDVSFIHEPTAEEISAQAQQLLSNGNLAQALSLLQEFQRNGGDM